MRLRLAAETSILLACGVLSARGATDRVPTSAPVDFSYAFAPPHRITVGRPDSSDRTLLDCQPGSLRMAWSYDDLTRTPLAALKTPATAWDIRITPQVDDRPLASSRWCRLEGFLPALENTYEDPVGSTRLEVMGAASAALVRVRLTNRDTQPHRFALRCESANWGENPAWVDSTQATGDNLVAGWNERADRVLILGIGADAWSLQADGRAPGPKAMAMLWNLKPGETRTGWLVRPYRGYASDLPNLRKTDWGKEAEDAAQEWKALIGRATVVTIPDEGVTRAMKACLADLFIMREPVADGYIAAVPGTEGYRSPNPAEAGIAAVALDQFGLHREAREGYRMCLEMQEPDGNWADPKGWCHSGWGVSGFKAWAAMEHYRLTGDRDYLAEIYPRLAASSRWQERQRARSRVMNGTERPLTYGLMPRGFGDCGLMNDDDMYGVFIPHNIWAVFADKLSVEAAQALGRSEDLDELRRIYETARDDLLAVMDRGAIRETDYRWIPGVAGKTSGSRWGALNAVFPSRLLPADHELTVGTLRKIESQMSKGGIPVHTGWMVDGMWVAITLDNIAEAHLVRGNGDAAVRYLYATLNHATPLVTWCEERGQEPGSSQCSGDRQHLWTPVAVLRAIRDGMVMEDGQGLQLALGTAREWLAGGKPVGISEAPTQFGPVSYEMRFDPDQSQVTGRVTFSNDTSCDWANLQIRLPDRLKAKSVNPDSGATLLPEGTGLRWARPRGILRFAVGVGE